MRIKNQNILIRTALECDADILSSWWNDGQIMAHAGSPKGIGTSKEVVMQQLKDELLKEKYRFMIEYNQKPIGEMCYIKEDYETVEIGIKICDLQYQNKALGKVILSMFIRSLFNMRYKKIKLSTMLNNKRAQHVYKKLGFCEVRINKDCWKDQLGELQSSIDYELKEEDFIEFSLSGNIS